MRRKAGELIRVAMAADGEKRRERRIARGQEVAYIWQSIQRAVQETKVMEDEWPNKYTTMCLPCGEQAKQVAGFIEEQAAKYEETVRKERRGVWDKKLKKTEGTTKKKSYQWLRQERATKMATMKDEEGMHITTAEGEMDAITKEWKPLFNMYKEMEPPTWEDFWKEYGEDIERECPDQTEVEVPVVSWKNLHMQAQARGTEKAGSLDGWRTVEVKKLPKAIFGMAAEVFKLIEKTGEWPEALLDVPVAMIPKGEAATAADRRPISCMSVWYSIWSTMRYKQTRTWQE